MNERFLPDARGASRRPAVLGRYRLLKKIGMGGMAEIWVASVASISGVRKICVLKQILPHLADSPDFVRMFLDEARIAATLDHPNLVQMYDIEEIDGVPVIAMEYLHGEDLRTIKRSLKSANRSMPIEHAIAIIAGIAAGLHYAHEKVGFDGKPLNIVHRDVSPHNVFVTYDGAVKILDFGIAKAANRVNETRDGALKGKVPYMSPEQCKSEKLDRRSDVYSAGILLYELSTGGRLFRRGATEFELMRAIVEDPVTPPRELLPDYPAALERIVLKCLARDRDGRYATARDLQADLEAFARENRLATSTLALSAFMAELFGQRLEAWRGALASGADLLSHIVERPNALGEDRSIDAHAHAATAHARRAEAEEVLATKRSAPLFSSASIEPARPSALTPVDPHEQVPAEHGAPRDLTVTKRRLGDLLVVSLSGRLTEEFQGLGLSRDVAGRVLFDLAGVSRITSFGVREWLTLLTNISQRVSELYLGRCSEPIVNQVSMIRRFAGDGRIVSFYGPYRCEPCGNSFERLFDCARDAEVLRRHEPKASPCPRCGAAAVFDDDAESYFAFATQHVGVQVPEDVRAALDELEKLDTSNPHEVLEKAVDDRGTHVRVRSKLDAQVRWKRALDGIEGDLVLDLTNAVDATPEGAQALELALRSLGDEVTSIRIEGCPMLLLEHLTAATPPLLVDASGSGSPEGALRPTPRIEIVTLMVDGMCERCNALRPARLDVKESQAAAREGRDPYTPCKRCNAPLSFPSLQPLLLQLAGATETGTHEPSDATPAELSPPEEPSPARTAEASAARRRRVGRGLAAGAALAALFGAIGLALRGSGEHAPTSTRAVTGQPTASAAATEAAATEPAFDRELPAWASPAFAAEAEQIYVVGKGGGATREAALADARDQAISRIVEGLVPALAGTQLRSLIRADDSGTPSPKAVKAIADRYLKQVGAIATPERVEALFQERGGKVIAVARYRLRKQDFEAAAQSYRKTVSILGFTAAQLFPLIGGELESSHEVVVVAVEDKSAAASAGVRVGDVIVAMNGRPAVNIDVLRRAAQLAADAAGAEIELEADGSRRVAVLNKPKNR